MKHNHSFGGRKIKGTLRGDTWSNAKEGNGWDTIRLRILTNATNWVKNNFNCNVLYATFEHNGMSAEQPAYCRLTIVKDNDTLKTEEVLLLVDGVNKFSFVSRENKRSEVVMKEIQRQIIRQMEG